MLKMIALTPMGYLKASGWNLFDAFIVVVSFAQMGLEGIDGLSALRTFRLVRHVQYAA